MLVKSLHMPALSATIITLNEEKNIARAIRSLSFVDEILVVDSGSKDKTIEIARSLGARVIHNDWPGYGAQKNFAQSQVCNDWILNIDADEEVTPELQKEMIQALKDHPNAQGFRMPRKTFYLGRWIVHGGWYPNLLLRLADRKFGRWTEPTVHEEWAVEGEVIELKNPLHHFTFSDIRDQILTNLNFSRLGYLELKIRGQRPSLGKLLLKPPGKFIETYFLKRGFMDGLPGLIISINAAHSMFLKYAYLIEAELEEKRPK